MIMRKISYIICKKYKCRHGEILVNTLNLPSCWKSRQDGLRLRYLYGVQGQDLSRVLFW